MEERGNQRFPAVVDSEGKQAGHSTGSGSSGQGSVQYTDM